MVSDEPRHAMVWLGLPDIRASDYATGFALETGSKLWPQMVPVLLRLF